ncbi:MAG: glycosyltransferase family 4 protein [Desulfovibrionaceae bacterium]|nr:glycosyltransferase family 4 protein [Desulfovibrionaceae bacterium]
MKTFQIVNVRWYNATAWYALYLSRLLAEAGHEVTVVTQPGTDTERRAEAMGLATAPLDLNTNNPLRLARTLGDMARLLRAKAPQVVNCHRGEGFFLWGILKKLGFDFKLVRTRGDQRLPKADFLNRWLHGSVADAVVVTNRRMAGHFLERMRTPQDKLWLIHGGVDTRAFAFDPEGRERVRREFGWRDQDLVVGLLGRFDRVKGQREIIEAVSMLRRERGLDNLGLLLIGYETSLAASDIESWLADFKVQDIARITGRRQDVAACVSALDIGVVASLWSEAIARSALEIMAADRPLLSTDVGVMPDLLPGRALVPAGDAAALARRLAEAIEDPEFRSSLVEEQRRTMSQLSGRDFLKRTLSLYHGLGE